MKKETKLNWYIFDAKKEILGRLSTKVANILRGKNNPEYEPSGDHGGFVVIINAEKIILTGKKESQKMYYKHTGYIGNLKEKTVSQLREEKPEEIIRHSVSGMLPKNKLRDICLGRLKIYKGSSHPHNNAKFVNQE